MGRRYAIVPEAQNGLDKLKNSVSNELGIEEIRLPEDGHWGYYPAHRCGEIGGNMVKKMIEAFEKKLVE